MMTFAFIRSLLVVTAGALVIGHAVVQWGRRRADAAVVAPALAIGFGAVAVGLALLGTGGAAAVVEVCALALVIAGLVALIRRRSRITG